GVDLGLAHLENIEVHLGRRELGKLAAKLFDVGALLADQHAGPRSVHRHAALLVRTLDHHLGDAAGATLLQDMVADLHILVQQPAILAAAGEPAAIPGAVDADSQPDRIYLVTHYAPSFAVLACSSALPLREALGFSSASCATSFTTTVSCEKGF